MEGDIMGNGCTKTKALGKTGWGRSSEIYPDQVSHYIYAGGNGIRAFNVTICHANASLTSRFTGEPWAPWLCTWTGA